MLSLILRVNISSHQAHKKDWRIFQQRKINLNPVSKKYKIKRKRNKATLTWLYFRRACIQASVVQGYLHWSLACHCGNLRHRNEFEVRILPARSDLSQGTSVEARNTRDARVDREAALSASTKRGKKIGLNRNNPQMKSQCYEGLCTRKEPRFLY